MKRSRLIPTSLAGGVAATMVLAACSDDDGAAGAATEDCPDGVVELSVLKLENNIPTQEAMDAYVEAKGGCVTFSVNEVPFGQLSEIITAGASAGNAPDIMAYDGPWTQSYAAQGLLAPLDDHLPEGFEEDITPATLAENTYEGSVYSPGMNEDAVAMLFNKTMTDAAGIEVPTTLEDAWTWDEAREAFEQCQVVKDGSTEVWGLAPSRLGDGTPGIAYRDLLFIRSNGDPDAPEDSTAYRTYWAQSPDGTEVEGWLNTPEAVEAAEFYGALFEDGLTSREGIPNAFVDGRACFDIDNMSAVGAARDADLDFEWGVTPMPYFVTPIVHTGSVTLGAFAGSEHVDEASEAVVFLSTGEFQLNWAEERARIPVLESLSEDADFLNEYPDSIYLDSVTQWGQPRPPGPNFAQYDQHATDALREIAYGGDAQQLLDRAAANIQQVID